MRIVRGRRLLGRRKQAPSKPQNASKTEKGTTGEFSKGAAHDGARSAALSLPNAFSPRHPHTFRFENSSYKYTTGVLTPSLPVQRAFDTARAAFKVYSQEGLSPSACTRVRNLLLNGDNLPAASSLASVFNYLYHFTAKAYSIADSITGVFFQVFRTRGDLKTLRLPWMIIPAGWRQWNMYCETYRSHPQATICVPQIRLALKGFNPALRTSRSLWYNSDAKIEVQIIADLKPSMLKAFKADECAPTNVTESLATGHVQKIVDDIICAMAPVAARFTLMNPAGFVANLLTAITAYLQNSDLHTLLDFQSIEMIVTNINRQRYVSSILLNPNGSKRDGDSDQQIRHPTSIQVKSGHRMDGVILSETTAEALGARTVSAQIEPVADDSLDLRSIKAADLIQEFDIVFRTSNEAGLKRCLIVAQHLAQKYPDTKGVLIFQPSKPQASDANLLPALNLELNSTSGVAHLALRIPRFSTKFWVSGYEEIELQILEATLLYGFPTQGFFNEQRSGSPQETMIAESSLAVESFFLICKSTAEKMQFSSLDEVSTKIAEVMLEVLDLPSLELTLEKVRLGVKMSEEPNAVFRGEASRETGQTAPERTSRQQHVAENILLSSNDGLQSSTRSTDKDRHSELSAEKREDRRASTLQNRNELRKAKRSEVGLWLPWTRSKVLEHCTGFQLFNVEMLWPGSNAPARMTSQYVIDQVEHGLQTESQLNASAADTMMSTFLGFEPPPRYVRMFLWIHPTPNPSNIPFSNRTGARQLMLSCCKDQSSNRASTISPENLLTISFPHLIVPLRVNNSGDADDTHFELYFTLKGDFTPGHPGPSKKLGEHVTEIFQAVHKATIQLTSGETFPNLQKIASDLTDGLLQKRHQLSAAINISEMKLKVSRRRADPSSPAVETIIATKAVGNDEIEDLEVETPSFSAVVPGFEEIRDLHATGGEGVSKTEFSETTLSILGPTATPKAGEEDATTPPESSAIVVGASEQGDEQDAIYSPFPSSVESKGPWRTAFIALGSNVGDRFKNIEAACREMDADPDIRIAQTSTLYESDAMYVTNQDPFLNGACEIATTLQPLELLDRLQAIENRLGRIKTIDKGPRNIDLDILFYSKVSLNTDRLTIPHPLMHEREFVLLPLVNMRCGERKILGRGMSVRTALKRLPESANPLRPFVPLDDGSQHINTFDPKRATRIMSVLNVTPDSFSDGGDNQTTDIESLKETIRGHIAAGAAMIDVGGQSSRPNAPDVTAEEEISRILPAIEAIRSMPEASSVIISVDTYRAAVAEAAIGAGAHIINDISAGQLDPDMLPTIAKLGCTYIMMHMRGTPADMMSEKHCSYPGGLIEEVGYELGRQFSKALKLGVRRWRIVLDPGIGFSKTPEQNVQLLRELPELRSRFKTSPWLIGTSRKSFIGKLTGVEDPKQRVWGTAATVTAAVMGGADIVRVHDVKEMADVVKMADAMYRV